MESLGEPKPPSQEEIEVYDVKRPPEKARHWKYPQEGEMNANQLAKELGVNHETVVGLAHHLIGESYGLIKERKNLTGGTPTDYFHPDLVAKIREAISSREIAPEGWMRSSALEEELGVERNVIKGIADEYAESNPEWFKEYMISGSNSVQLFEHYSLELSQIIKKEVEQIKEFRGKFKERPEGWLTLTEISNKLKLDKEQIKEMMNLIQDKDPKLMNVFFADKAGNIRKHWPPMMISELERMFTQLYEHRSPPDRWISAAKLANSISNSVKATDAKLRDIQEIAISLKSEYPEHFGIFYPNRTGGSTTYYHPDLANRIKAIIKEREAKYTSKLRKPAQ